jgi:Ca2+-binding RTX toxin-like protein
LDCTEVRPRNLCLLLQSDSCALAHFVPPLLAAFNAVRYLLVLNFSRCPLENLTLIGSASINGTGNSVNNTITGNGSANVLNGNGGADTLIGGRGNDTYIVDSTDDTIVEVASVTDTDTVQSSITWNLGYSLENLTLTATSAINGTGNEGDNIIVGNSANNILDGANGGTDRLTGLGGADTFRFSTRPTSFRNTSADHITDFSSAQGDKIQITKSAFGITASTATLSVVNTAAALNTALSGSAQFIYNTANGELHWNQNGITRGAGSGSVLAILDNKATLSAGDLILV